jgi:hypothetical protein
MTQAVCFKCGSLKFGAFSNCERCGARPQSDDDLMLSLAFTDHYFDRASLERIGADIAAGVPPQLDPTTKEKLRPAVQEAKRMLGLGEGKRRSAAPRTARSIDGVPKKSGVFAPIIILVLLFAVTALVVGATLGYMPGNIRRSLDYVVIPIAVLWFLWSWFKWHGERRANQNLLDVLEETIQEHERGRHDNTEYIEKQIAFIERNQKLTPKLQRLLERARNAIQV